MDTPAISTTSFNAPPSEPSAGAQILAALDGRINPVRASPMYLLGLLLVAALMLLLPLIYLAVIAAIAYAVYWHAVNDAFLLQTVRSAIAVAVLYVGPIVAGAVVVLFMIKPLFNRRKNSAKPLTLKRDEEPLIYAYVDHLCDIVGARRPSRIDVDCQVNASASFVGIAGMFTGDLVLTIGLPFAAGLDLRLFSGVLAHELGHFAQGSGMRLSYLIRAISGWFWRVVFERDSWDQALVRGHKRGGHVAVKLICGLCRLAVWLTRRLLWCLMWLGAMISSMMSRQMEFDADRYEARIAGSDSVEQTFARLTALNAAFGASLAELSTAWRERRLADDLPMLVCNREAAMDGKIRQSLMQKQSAAKTRLFDSHPCDTDRIASARREKTPGIIKLDLPATSLFKDFKELSCVATMRFYQQSLGPALRPEHVYTTETMVDKRDAQRESFTSLKRYFQGLVSPLRPLSLVDVGEIPSSSEEQAALITEARTVLAECGGAAMASAKAFEDANGILDRVRAVSALRAAQMKVDPKLFGFKSADNLELEAAQQRSETARRQAAETLSKVLAPQARRLRAALSLASAAAPRDQSDAPAVDGHYEVSKAATSVGGRQLDALCALWRCESGVERLRQRTVQLNALLSVTRKEGNKQTLIGEILTTAKRAYGDLQAVHETLRTAPYPYEHTERGATISRFCCAQLPARDRIGDIHNAARATLNGVYGLYMRLMSDLAQLAENAEQALGLPPLENSEQ